VENAKQGVREGLSQSFIPDFNHRQGLARLRGGGVEKGECFRRKK
jgi:hypothetical protein